MGRIQINSARVAKYLNYLTSIGQKNLKRRNAGDQGAGLPE